MLRWCAYCQRFQGEVAPFEDLSHTHGICQNCKANELYLVDAKIDHASKLKEMYDLLMEAGKTKDMSRAEQLVDAALMAGMLPVEILLGLVGPSLYVIGEQWEQGVISVAEEHQFTSFCERIFDLTEERVRQSMPRLSGKQAEIFLLNTYGNRHPLAIRILMLWFQSRGISARMLSPAPSHESLVEAIRHARPRLILISIALADQRVGLLELITSINSIPPDIRPSVIVGGYAVKSGSITPIPGVTFLEDISQLEQMI